jgi:hypothetical protein
VDRAENNVADENPRSPASNKDCCGVADPTPGGEGSSIRVGDWVLPLSAEGVLIPESEFPPPYLSSKIESGSDGALYAQFMENGKDWPLAQCERTDSPSPPPDDVEEF